MKLENQLKKWQEAGLIGEKEFQAILQYEDNQPEKSYILFGIVGIGVTALVCGLISIIAANWNDISSNTKLIAYFLLQTSLGLGYLKTSNTRPGLKTTLLWLFTLNFFGGIGLVGQIYHLSGAFWRPLAFWLSLSLLPTLLEERKLLIHCWLITFFFTCILYLIDSNHNPIYFCAAAFLITAIGFNGITRFLGFPENFERLSLKYGVPILLLSSSVFGNSLWRVNPISVDLKKILPPLFILFLSAAIALSSAILRNPAFTGRIKTHLSCLAALILFYLALPSYYPLLTTNEIIGAFGFIAIWGLAAWIAAALNLKHAYNLMTFVIALRLIVVYFEIFGSLIATGFGLIISGLVILLTAYFWNKCRQIILKWVQQST